ncbi:MAG: hypothetical protein ACRD4S_05505 [Candidatus Acidiferrales bacterium]
MAQPVAGFTQRSFTNGRQYASALFGLAAPAFSPADFQASTNFTGSTLGRNAFRGPGFFGSDFSIRKSFTITERVNFQLGLDAYNVFNHANYGAPFSNNAFGGAFGSTGVMYTPPTSPYGAFAAAATDMRMAQIQGKLTF